jgi:hypothetical protein
MRSLFMIVTAIAVAKIMVGLGYPVSELQIMDKRINGTDTYVTLRARDGKDYTCVINGGNLLSFGMTNPTICRSKR